MVAKISLGKSIYGALTYNAEKINKEKGRVLDTNLIFNDGSGKIDIGRAFEDFKRWMPSNTRTERPMMHISLNPHPDDRLSDMDYARLAHEYMEKMGFGEMPYIIVKHADIERQHIHIVALRVGTDGRAISDKNNFYRSKEITRELERKYGLKPAERQKITPDMPIRKVDPSGDIKRQVANTVKMVGMRYKFQTLGEFNAILSLYNIRCEQTDGRVNGREYHGLVYFATDDNGNTIATPFKASRLGKFASRTAIDSRFERAKDKIDIRPTRRKVKEILQSAYGKDDFISKLKEVGIDIVLRYTEEGRIYGATYIDHNTQTVLNGSRLGKDFSANALNERFNREVSEDENQYQPEQAVDETTANDESQHEDPIEEQEEHNDPEIETPDIDNSDTESQEADVPEQDTYDDTDVGDDGATVGEDDEYEIEDYSITLPGLDLFHQGMAYNPDEEEFARRMRRKKKKGGLKPKR